MRRCQQSTQTTRPTPQLNAISQSTPSRVLVAAVDDTTTGCTFACSVADDRLSKQQFTSVTGPAAWPMDTHDEAMLTNNPRYANTLLVDVADADDTTMNVLNCMNVLNVVKVINHYSSHQNHGLPGSVNLCYMMRAVAVAAGSFNEARTFFS
jgi:hypothetical protein